VSVAQMDEKYDFEIIIGSYENFVIGYKYYAESKTLTNSFATDAHKGCVRSIASSGQYVATGGTDEAVNVYDLDQRKHLCNLMHHSGTVSSLQFTPDGSHLITAGQDGALCIIKAGSWIAEKTWTKAHKGAEVNGVAIHPSGKLALSLGQNRSLKTWNLLKGRIAYTTNLSSLDKMLDQVIWSPNGTYYAISTNNHIYVFDTSIAGIVCSIYCSSKISAMTFLEDGIVCLGEEEGWLIGYSIDADTALWQIRAFEGRIKCISCVSGKWIVVCASMGAMAVYKIRSAKKEPYKKAVADIGCRPICMTVRNRISE